MAAQVFRRVPHPGLLECFLEIGQPPPAEDAEGWLERYKKIFKLRCVHLMALFAFTYVGHEVTVGSECMSLSSRTLLLTYSGWIVTYIINERNGGPNSGYISSGFFGGLMLGRVALLWFSKLVSAHCSSVLPGQTLIKPLLSRSASAASSSFTSLR